jgi:hypothetical protein
MVCFEKFTVVTCGHLLLVVPQRFSDIIIESYTFPLTPQNFPSPDKT